MELNGDFNFIKELALDPNIGIRRVTQEFLYRKDIPSDLNPSFRPVGKARPPSQSAQRSPSNKQSQQNQSPSKKRPSVVPGRASQSKQNIHSHAGFSEPALPQAKWDDSVDDESTPQDKALSSIMNGMSANWKDRDSTLDDLRSFIDQVQGADSSSMDSDLYSGAPTRSSKAANKVPISGKKVAPKAIVPSKQQQQQSPSSRSPHQPPQQKPRASSSPNRRKPAAPHYSRQHAVDEYAEDESYYDQQQQQQQLHRPLSQQFQPNSHLRPSRYDSFDAASSASYDSEYNNHSGIRPRSRSVGSVSNRRSSQNQPDDPYAFSDSQLSASLSDGFSLPSIMRPSSRAFDSNFSSSIDRADPFSKFPSVFQSSSPYANASIGPNPDTKRAIKTLNSMLGQTSDSISEISSFVDHLENSVSRIEFNQYLDKQPFRSDFPIGESLGLVPNPPQQDPFTYGMLMNAGSPTGFQSPPPAQFNPYMAAAAPSPAVSIASVTSSISMNPYLSNNSNNNGSISNSGMLSASFPSASSNAPFNPYLSQAPPVPAPSVPPPPYASSSNPYLNSGMAPSPQGSAAKASEDANIQREIAAMKQRMEDDARARSEIEKKLKENEQLMAGRSLSVSMLHDDPALKNSSPAVSSFSASPSALSQPEKDIRDSPTKTPSFSAASNNVSSFITPGSKISDPRSDSPVKSSSSPSFDNREPSMLRVDSTYFPSSSVVVVDSESKRPTSGGTKRPDSAGLRKSKSVRFGPVDAAAEPQQASSPAAPEKEGAEKDKAAANKSKQPDGEVAANNNGAEQDVPDEVVKLIFSKARHGKVVDIEKMLDGGVPVDVRDAFGNSLLCVAAQNGNRAVMKMLLKKGANINAQNHKGHTPLHFSFAYGYSDLGEYLVSKGADDSVRNIYGLSCYEGLGPR